MDRPPTSDRHTTKRPALAERQPRVGQTSTSTKPHELGDQVMSSRMPHHESLEPEGNMLVRARDRAPPQTIENKRLSAVTDEAAIASKRGSQASTISNTSVTTKDRIKTHIGPWQLGKTLGTGSTGRVRLAKHARTGRLAAVKIISKKCNTLAKSQSVAQMNQTEAPQVVAGQRPIPFSIEREIVVLKLIEHENIVNLYDIWENRGEIYLIMEYVQGGELFTYVSRHGRLPEQEAVRLFRQIIASLSYCHRFNVCHRDLKPENLLMDDEQNIKLADFGMAALQPEGRWLTTSCGSPHYAAPEIICGKEYRGTEVDIWSCGIILYAMISGKLPFDGGALTKTLHAIKRGAYRLPKDISPEAGDLIERILQQNPEHRITMEEIWEHPLLTKWEAHHTRQLPEGKQLVGPPPPLHEDDCGERIMSREDIDNEILRNLQTLWHGYNKADLIDRLMSEAPNHERLFYRELMRFREEQQEDYPGSPLQYSKSDYHHPLKPKKPAKRGAEGAAGNHYRRGSQYSIVSDDGPSKRGSYYKKPATAATNASYDPYRASRTPILEGTGDSPTIIVRRDPSATLFRNVAVTRLQDEIPDLPSFTSEELHKTAHQKKSPASATTSKGSMPSMRHDRGVQPSLTHKRSVKFQHRRQKSSGNATGGSNVTRSSLHASSDADSHLLPTSKVTNHGMSELQNTPSVSRTPHMKRPRNTTSELDLNKTRTTSGIWREDARKVSTELSKICEEAFNRSSVTSSDVSRSRLTSSQGTDSPATATSIHQNAAHAGRAVSRGLPETPEQHTAGTALKELAGTRRRIIDNWGDSDPASLAEILVKLDERIDLEQVKMKQADQRAASDPSRVATTNTPHIASLRGQKLPSNTNTMDDLMDRRQDRAASDPGKRKQAPNDTTIKLVSPDPMSPTVPLEPIQVRKKNKILMPLNSLRGGSSESSPTKYERNGYDPRILGKRDLDTIEENPKSPKQKSAFGSGTAGRKWSWLGKRGLEQEDNSPTPPEGSSLPPSPIHSEQAAVKNSSEPSSNIVRLKHELVTSEEVQGQLENKKWFPKIFSRKEKAEFPLLANDHAILQDGDDETASNGSNEQQGKETKIVRKSYPPATSVDAAAAASPAQPIQINQNWFAKFFHIKPASRVLVLQISKAKARKEIVKKLKEWRKYGIRDVIVEKRAGGNVIRGRVDAQNYLHLKPVHFYCQVYTVLEHGRNANLSAAKFTQERGAASSFNKVVNTLEAVLDGENALVTNPARQKGIERSLKEAGI